MSEKKYTEKDPWRNAFAYTREYVRRMKAWKKRSKTANEKIGPSEPRF